MMQGPSFMGDPYMYYGYMGCPYPMDPAMWQQMAAQWNMNFYGYPAVKPGQGLSPDTPDENMDMRMADLVEMTAFNPPLPPEEPEMARPPLPPEDDGPLLVYDDDRSVLTMSDTLGFYARYYAYQDSKHRHKTGKNQKSESRKSKESLKDIPLPPKKSPNEDLNNNTKETITSAQGADVSLTDIPLPPAISKTLRKASNTWKDVKHLLKRNRKLKKQKLKHLKKREKVKLKRKVKSPRSENLKKESVKTGEYDKSPICLSD